MFNVGPAATARILVACTFALWGLPSHGAKADSSLVVKTASGPVAGFARNGARTYLGIPYAAPPTGALRWMPPQPAAPWTAVRPALKFGNSCAQNGDVGVFASPSPHEDCLYLNIYANPQASPAQKKPVMVWIYGGGLYTGESDDYDGSKLAADGGTVVVTFNYRLGVLGWLAHPALDKEGHAFANYGMLDQQFALQWVRQNIEAFGGDPGNVTIFGESAGATSVISHLISPQSKGPFQHAIAMSGGAAIIRYPLFGSVGSATPLDAAEEKGQKFATAAGCADQGVECLRRLSVGKILATQSPYIVNETIIDGSIIPTTYKAALSSGQVNRVTFVNGSTHDEWRWVYGFIENMTGKPLAAEGYLPALKGFFGDALGERVRAEYSLDHYASPSEAISAASTDSLWA